jgi:hypothetical protein
VAKALRVVGAVASVVALIPGPHQPIAQAVAVAANVGAMILQKKPPAQGSVNEVRIGPNLPTPCAIGNYTYVGGNRMHDVGYGPETGGVKNPYRSMVDVWSLGPVQSVVALQADFTNLAFSGAAATGYYSGFLWKATQMGACPELSALSGPHGAIPNWGATAKLSGLAAGLWTLKFDKKGKVYASGPPQFGAILAGVYVYDQRQDSTYPGGSGACRAKNEATYVGGAAADNPSCHAVTYALGRYQNGKKVFGCGFEVDAIDWPAWTAFANHCDANEWKSRGTIFEPGSRWDNLKRICEAGGGEPIFVGAKLSVRYNAPKVSLFTITADDLADGDPSIPGMRTYRDRKNILVPRYRSEAHKWEYVQASEVAVEEYIDADGEEKPDEVQFDLVQDATQATQLAAYRLVNAREITPIVLHCKPWLMHYQLGEAGTIDLPEEGLDGVLCEIIGRSIDPATASVTLTLRTETNDKHPFALGLTGTAPPTPTLDTAEDLDEVASSINNPITPTVASEAAMLALDIPPGGRVKRSDLNQVFEHNGGTTGTMSDWTLVAVTSGGTAATTPFTPAGAIAATNVQAAIVELDTEKQPANANLTAFAGLATAADRLGYWTGSGSAALATFTPAGRTVVGSASVTGSGSPVLATSPTVSGLTNTGTLTAAASTLGGAATFSFSTAAAATEFIRLSATGNAGATRGPFISFYPPNNSNSSLFQGSIGAYGNTGGGVQINGPSNTQVARFPDAGAVITGSVTASSYIKPGSFTVATLPSAATAGAGARAYVTDANATTFNTIVAGGGANKIPVTSDGANWKIG